MLGESIARSNGHGGDSERIELLQQENQRDHVSDSDRMNPRGNLHTRNIGWSLRSPKQKQFCQLHSISCIPFPSWDKRDSMIVQLKLT